MVRRCVSIVAKTVVVAFSGWGLLWVGCSRSGDSTQGASGARAAAVSVAKAHRQTVPLALTSFGQVQAFSMIQVKSLVGGMLTKAHFKEGQPVKADQLILEIDKEPYEAALRQAKANLDKDRIQTKNARREADRLQELFEKKAATLDERDNSRAAADALDATVVADEAAVQTAQLQLNYCDIRSPVDGVIGMFQVDRGNIVKANDVPLVTINQVSPIYVTFSLPQQDLPTIREHMAHSKLAIEASPPRVQQVSRGILEFVDNAVDPTTGTIRLRGVFENTGHRLWPGEFVNVSLILTQQQGAIIVPSSAVQASQAGQYVYVVEADMTARMAPVVVDRMLDDHTVVRTGLAGNETVITDGQLNVVPGSKVQIRPEVKPLEAASRPASAPSPATQDHSAPSESQPGAEGTSSEYEPQ